jgi:hypothetical protein
MRIHFIKPLIPRVRAEKIIRRNKLLEEIIKDDKMKGQFFVKLKELK